MREASKPFSRLAAVHEDQVLAVNENGTSVGRVWQSGSTHLFLTEIELGVLEVIGNTGHLKWSAVIVLIRALLKTEMSMDLCRIDSFPAQAPTASRSGTWFAVEARKPLVQPGVEGGFIREISLTVQLPRVRAGGMMVEGTKPVVGGLEPQV